MAGTETSRLSAPSLCMFQNALAEFSPAMEAAVAERQRAFHEGVVPRTVILRQDVEDSVVLSLSAPESCHWEGLWGGEEGGGALDLPRSIARDGQGRESRETDVV